jgi:hypothetical protein
VINMGGDRGRTNGKCKIHKLKTYDSYDRHIYSFHALLVVVVVVGKSQQNLPLASLGESLLDVPVDRDFD